MTPAQILLATVLGAMLGFVPGFMQGPGLFILLLLLLIVLNANFFIGAMVGGLAKLLSLVLMPVSFQIGRVLLDGPTQAVFKKAINTPVLALFGFEHYATTGGMALGLVFGVVSGVGLIWMMNSLRRTMAGLEQGSERYQKAMSKGWVRAMLWVFVGPMQGKTYAELLTTKKVGNPVRVIGVVFAALAVGLLFVLQMFFSEPIVTAALKRGLEQANGATVDIGSADLNLKEGRLVVTGLAMADPNDLKTDLLRAKSLVATISTTDLLTKRIAMDKVLVADASQGESRAIPGRLIGPARKPKSSPMGLPTIEDFLKNAEVWKDRLAQVRKWLEDMSGDEDPGVNPDGTPKTPRQKNETLRERLAREIAEKGYARVTASHLIEGAPSFLVRELVVDGVRTKELGDDLIDVRGENLSTNPRLVQAEPRLTVKSRSARLEGDIRLGSPGAGQTGGIVFVYRGIVTDSYAAQMVQSNPAPVAGGTTDVSINGSWSPQGVGYVDLPLLVTLRNAVVSIPGAGSAPVEEFSLPLGIKGSIDNPGIVIDQSQLADALAKAGANELAKRARGEAEKQVEKVLDKAGDQIGDKAKGALGDILGGIGGKKKEEPPK